MNLNRLVIMLLMLVTTVSASADRTEDLKHALPNAKGDERIRILGELYNLSQETDDVDYQIRCINELINECQKQKNKTEEADARVLPDEPLL